MPRQRISLIAMLVAMTALPAVTIVKAGSHLRPPEAPTAPAVDPEHDRLIAMCGTWDVELTFWFKPGGPGLTAKGTSTIRALLGGLFIEEKIEGTLNGAPFTTLAWTGYNTDSHKFEATRIASTNTDPHRRDWRLRRARRNSSSSRPTTRSRATPGTSGR